MRPPVVNALSVDVEEYYHAAIFRAATGGRGPFESRVEQSTDRVLELFAAAGARATCFVVGEVARARPGVVRKIARQGHEVGCHSDLHQAVFRQTPAEFRADLRRAKQLLEDLAGTAVVGYRAPDFSIGREQAWAYGILVEEGFRYDSSAFPILHDRYGDRRMPRFPFTIPCQGGGELIEFPVGTVRIGSLNLPVGGGGYFRLLPWPVTSAAIRWVNAREGRPVMFYFHPWELDTGQPRPRMSWSSRFRHYVGIGREEAKLGRLLRRFRFSPARDVLGLN